MELGFTLLISAAVLCMIGGLGFRGLWPTLNGTLRSPITLTLTLSILLLGLFNSLLKETGLLEKFISGLYAIIEDRRAIASSLATLVGFLPILGGAVFSAPLVEKAAEGMNLEAGQKAAINVFYRHIIYLVYPLYPAMIITAEFTGLKIGRLLLNNLPAMIVAATLSLFIMFKGTGPFRAVFRVSTKALAGVLPVFLTLLLIILLVVWVNVYFPLAIFVGLVSVFLFFLFYPGSTRTLKQKEFWLNILRSGLQYRILLAVLGILFLKDTLEATGVLKLSLQQLMNSGFPLFLLAILTSLLASLLTEDNTAAMGILLPVFLTLEGFRGPGIYGFTALMYVSAFVGNVMSPVHICLSLTKEYFQADFSKIYRYLAPPLLWSLLVTILLYVLSQKVL